MRKIPLLEAVNLLHICPGLCFQNFYRPQTKFAKVMFLHVSVSHSVPKGGTVSQHALQVSRLTPGGKLSGLAWGGLRPTPRGQLRVWLGGSPGPHLGGVSPGPHPGRGSPGPHPGGVGGIPACTEADTSSPR